MYFLKTKEGTGRGGGLCNGCCFDQNKYIVAISLVLEIIYIHVLT